jgi:hypothetical protein
MFVGNVLEMWGSFWEFFLSDTLYFFSSLHLCVFNRHWVHESPV